MYMYVISYYNCPKNSRETCSKSIFELLVHSCESTGFMKLSKDQIQMTEVTCHRHRY